MLLNCGVGKDSWESSDCKEIKPVNSKGNQSWIFIGRTDAETGTPILWPPDAKNWVTGKDPDAGKNWRQKKKGMTEDEMVGWHHWLDGHEFEQALGVGDGQGGLVCCSPWGCKELDMTERLNWTELDQLFSVDPRLWLELKIPYSLAYQNSSPQRMHASMQLSILPSKISMKQMLIFLSLWGFVSTSGSHILLDVHM